jgi:hypothetical protein
MTGHEKTARKIFRTVRLIGSLLAQPLRTSAGWYIGSGCNNQRRPSIRS